MQAEKRWGCTNYGFEFTKKIKEIEAEKSWGLDKLWICQKKQNKKTKENKKNRKKNQLDPI